MTLQEAIEEVHKAYDLLGEECCPDDKNNPMEVAVCAILNAIINGTLIPADAVFQVREGYEVDALEKCDLGYPKYVDLSEALEIRSADAVRRETLEAISAIPTPRDELIMEGHEEAYRAIEALIDTPQPEPCNCICHSQPGVTHVVACCNRPPMDAFAATTGAVQPMTPTEMLKAKGHKVLVSGQVTTLYSTPDPAKGGDDEHNS